VGPWENHVSILNAEQLPPPIPPPNIPIHNLILLIACNKKLTNTTIFPPEQTQTLLILRLRLPTIGGLDPRAPTLSLQEHRHRHRYHDVCSWSLYVHPPFHDPSTSHGARDENRPKNAQANTFPIPPAVVFTLRAVGQDKFEDVIVPDAPQKSQTAAPKNPQGQVNGMRS
jgi:hypothetical protein